jgi:hypothetical protein
MVAHRYLHNGDGDLGDQFQITFACAGAPISLATVRANILALNIDVSYFIQ